MNILSYENSQAAYAELGVDTEAALSRLATIPVSMHCWQGDDVGGFEKTGSELGGGLAVTGNYPGKARTISVAARSSAMSTRSRSSSAGSTGHMHNASGWILTRRISRIHSPQTA